MKTRKGISPLIATVLLIGFTVALAAVLMTWGLDYVKKSTEQVGSKTEEYLKCSDLAFEITNVDCAGDIIVQNNANIDIAGMTLRVYVGPDIAIVNGAGIPSFANAHYTAALTGATKVEAIASVKGSTAANITCKDNIKEFATAC